MKRKIPAKIKSILLVSTISGSLIAGQAQAHFEPEPWTPFLFYYSYLHEPGHSHHHHTHHRHHHKKPWRHHKRSKHLHHHKPRKHSHSHGHYSDKKTIKKGKHKRRWEDR